MKGEREKRERETERKGERERENDGCFSLIEFLLFMLVSLLFCVLLAKCLLLCFCISIVPLVGLSFVITRFNHLPHRDAF